MLPGVVEIRGLTVWNPMAWAIALGHKPIENRTRRPFAGVSHLAIHVGKWHEQHRQQMLDAEIFAAVPTRGMLAPQQGCVVAVARVLGYVTSLHDELFTEQPDARAWFSGPFGWVLGDVREVAQPLPCKGMLGAWVLPASVREQLLPLCS